LNEARAINIGGRSDFHLASQSWSGTFGNAIARFAIAFRELISKTCEGVDAMMSNKEFAELELRATICPQQCRWPKSEYVHWQKLHEAANEARARVSKFYALADEIDRNADLSRDQKYRERSKIADEAIANFEASKAPARAREAVKLAVAKNDSPDGDATLKAMNQAERGWQSGDG
jgi:hypothetical protein